VAVIRAAVVLIAICAAADVTLAQGGAALGADDFVAMALRRNRDIQAERERATEAQGLLRQAGIRPAPAIAVEESSARPFGDRGEQMFSAGYFHTFETSGKRAKRVAVASKSTEVIDADIADRTRLLTLDVKVRYVEAVREQEKLLTLQRLSSASHEHYDLTRARVERGDAAPLVSQLLRVEVSRLEAREIVQNGSAERALLALRKAAGMDAGESIALAGFAGATPMGRSLADLQAQALRDRPDLRAAARAEEQAQAETAVARADNRTDVTASAQYALTDSRFDQLGFDPAGRLVPLRDRSHSLSVGLSFFLFAPGRSQGAIDAAEARASAARLRREHLESGVRLDVEAAFRRWQAARRALEIFDSAVVTQSAENLSVIRQAYTLGQLRVLDVLVEQQRLLETQMAYLDAQAELFEAFAELEASVGGRIQ
jgi:cobalt-zinc-cadmium efflux system outer membrane protein